MRLAELQMGLLRKRTRIEALAKSSRLKLQLSAAQYTEIFLAFEVVYSFISDLLPRAEVTSGSLSGFLWGPTGSFF
jgi:hypothetical protein